MCISFNVQYTARCISFDVQYTAMCISFDVQYTANVCISFNVQYTAMCVFLLMFSIHQYACWLGVMHFDFKTCHRFLP